MQLLMVLKKRRLCPECGKSFKEMSNALWTVNYYMHRLTSLRHGPLPRDAAYVERMKADYIRERQAQGLAF
jgi:hypothetical protein